MSGTRRMSWLYIQTACSELKKQTEAVESVENTMTVSNKFIKILKLSFKLMNDDYKSQISELQKKNINTVEVKMDRLFHEVIDSKNSNFDDCVTLALSYLYMSYIYIDNQNRIHISKKYLQKTLELLKGKELDCKAILIVMRVHNELSYIETVIQNITEAKIHLDEALQLYIMFTKEKDDYPIPIDVANNLQVEDKVNCKCLLERIYQATLEGLLDVENVCVHVKSTDIPKVVIYMHKLLSKQLNATDTDYITWAINSAHLSTYFTSYGRFTEARNHLAAANFMIQQYFLDIYQKVEESNTTIENVSHIRYRQASSIIADYWAKYGLALLNLSRERTIIRDTEDKVYEASTSQSNESECSAKSNSQPKDLLIFSDIEKDLKEFAAPITDKCPLDYKEAKKVFVSVLKWFNDVQAYTKDNNTDDIIVDKLADQYSIAIGTSTAYKYLAYYEQDKNNKIKLYKRQIDVIEKVIKTSKLTPKTEIYKQLCNELIFTYTTMMDMMTENSRADKPELSKKEQLEVEQLARQCLTSLKLYINSCNVIDEV